MTESSRESLVVDMVKCDGHGICAWLFPARVDLDEWGYAWVDATPLETPGHQRAARAAVRACPKRALSLVSVPAAANTVSR